MQVKAKYYHAASQEEAAALAAQYFGCTPSEVSIDVMQEGGENTPGLYLAFLTRQGDYDPTKDMNGFFKLYYDEDGVYFELIPCKGAGEPQFKDDALIYIQRKAIQGLDPAPVLALFEQGFGRAKIGPPQAENILNEDVAVLIAPDAMQASIRFLPKDTGGQSLTLEEITARLQASGVTHGIESELIQAALDEKASGQNYVVARAIPAQNGENGVLTFHFRRDFSGRPKIDENDKVDYRTLDLFEEVKSGQLLVERALATPGVTGYAVTGKELKPKPGRDVNMPKGKNVTFNEEKTLMHSSMDGRVEFVANSVNVSNVYVVSGNCDMSVGNIDFNGSVHISGNVISGMTVKASGSITVGGVVEAATLEAGGSIELKRGIQGMDRGQLIAEGSIVAVYIERAIVRAGGTITADAIIHSNLEAGGSLYLKGKRANIVGGTAQVTKEVVATAIGSVSATATDIYVGLVPSKRNRMQFLDEELKRLREEYEKLEKLEMYLSKTPEQLDEKRKALAASVLESKKQNTQLSAEYSEEYNELQTESQNATGGRVHVFDTAYPGAKITIASAIYRVEEEIRYATFKFSNGEVIFTACEAGR